jgi:hypothetical protein
MAAAFVEGKIPQRNCANDGRGIQLRRDSGPPRLAPRASETSNFFGTHDVLRSRSRRTYADFTLHAVTSGSERFGTWNGRLAAAEIRICTAGPPRRRLLPEA